MTDALTQAALIGTGRHPLPEVELPTEIRATGPEQQLLRAAAVLRVYRAAGRKPERVSSLPEPAPGETRRVCPPAAAAHLTMILGTYPDLLEEWLDALAAAGMVIPATHIRALLDLAAREESSAIALEPVLSERARWLAAQHGPWGWAAGRDPEERWQTGTRAERLHILAVRPELAHRLVASTWADDSARDREAFIAAVRDEPFLERALGDRSQNVRAQAAIQLSAIPGSALSERMRARALGLIDASRRTLNVQLPGELTPELARDGLNGSPPHGMGRGAWLVSQIIALAPLDAWEPDILKRRVADGMGDVLREAWATAAMRQRNAAWAAALLARSVAVPRELVAIAPAEVAEHHALEAIGLADAVPAPWSERFSRLVAERIAADEHTGDWPDALAQRGDPRLADQLPQGDPASNAGRQLRVVAAKLALRRTMLETIKENA